MQQESLISSFGGYHLALRACTVSVLCHVVRDEMVIGSNPVLATTEGEWWMKVCYS